jgi:hypothetical protein
MEKINEFLGSGEKSTTRQWLEQCYITSPSGVEEFVLLAQEAHFKTIGHFFSNRRNALPVIQKILSLSGNYILGYELLSLSIGELQNILKEALQVRDRYLMDIQSYSVNDSELEEKWCKTTDAFEFTDIHKYVVGLCTTRNHVGEFYHQNRGISMN